MKKFFASDRLLDGAMVLALTAEAADMAAKLACGWYTPFIFGILLMLLIIALYVSYRKHNKNLQKGLIGVILCWDFYSELNYHLTKVVFSGEMHRQLHGAWGRIWVISSGMIILFYALYFVNYFLITARHESSPNRTRGCQILCFALIGLSVVSAVSHGVLLTGQPWVFTESLAWHVFFMGFMLMLTSYQTHFEVWREKREQ